MDAKNRAFFLCAGKRDKVFEQPSHGTSRKNLCTL